MIILADSKVRGLRRADPAAGRILFLAVSEVPIEPQEIQ
jgi:hypothetical protein